MAGKIEYRFNKTDTVKERVFVVSYKNTIDKLFKLIKIRLKDPDVILFH